ncbi:NAD-binding lipoprotein [Streptomyces sp. NPDC088387]|uniref:CASTOR/POLLUX-related putative ion channel n=1 Tax=Streptomyces sp. NPDC088387 TaxID=3365859 RepID=UPI00381A2159
MERRQGTPGLRDRARYLFDRTLAHSSRALLGWVAVCCLAVVVPLSALLVWTDPDAPHSMSGRIRAVWRTSAETLRLGGATGAPMKMLLSVVLGLIALLCVSTVVGVITTGLGERLAELQRGRSRVLERDHAVVLGWSDQVFTVVGELIASRAGRAGGVVAVLARRDPADMHAALVTTLGHTGGVRIVCRSGAPSDPEALALVSPREASSVLVLPTDEADTDAAVVRVLLALRTLLGTRSGPPVVAAVRDARHLPAARLAAGPHGTVLESDRATARLLVQSARRPGLATALRDLLDFSGAEFHVLDVPDVTGRTFEEVALSFEESCAVGIQRSDGRLLLTPAPGTAVAPGDLLVTVAHDNRPVAPADCRTHVDDETVVSGGVRPEGPSRILLLGWNRRAPLVVDVLRRTARPGSTLDVVTGPDARAAVTQVPRTDDSGHLSVVHHVGDPADLSTLRSLDVVGYDRVVVLGADQQTGVERPDDATLLTLLNLRSLEDESGSTPPVVAELSDHRSRALALLSPAWDTVVHGELTALLMTQISQNPALAAVFEEIFATRGGALTLRPAADYVLPGHETSFATVVAAGLRHQECAIGYRAHDPRAQRLGDGIRLCPRKSERRVWKAEDEILVLTAGHGITTHVESPSLPGARHEHTQHTHPSDSGAEEGGSSTGLPQV